MIYICIPAHNEEQTVGVVLWKIRQVMAEFPRDYQILVADDASTDKTSEVLTPYARVLPLTVVRTDKRRGYAASLEMLLREAVRRSEYPKRDVILTIQADFSQEPEDIIPIMKAMEAGADIVCGEATLPPETAWKIRWSRRMAGRLLKGKSVPQGVKDPFTGFSAYRVFTVKKAMDERAGGRLLLHDSWAANAELLAVTAPHARRVDALDVTVRPHRLQRASRLHPWPALKNVWAYARKAKPEIEAASTMELDESVASGATSRLNDVASVRERMSERSDMHGNRSPHGDRQPHNARPEPRGRGERPSRDRNGSPARPPQNNDRARSERPRKDAERPRAEPRTADAPRAERPKNERQQNAQNPRSERKPKEPRNGDRPARVRNEPAAASAEPIEVDAAAASQVTGADENATPPLAGGEPTKRRRRRGRRSRGGANKVANSITGDVTPLDDSSEIDAPAQPAQQVPRAQHVADAAPVQPGDDIQSGAADASTDEQGIAPDGSAGEGAPAKKRRRGRRGGRGRRRQNAAAGDNNTSATATSDGDEGPALSADPEPYVAHEHVAHEHVAHEHVAHEHVALERVSHVPAAHVHITPEPVAVEQPLVVREIVSVSPPPPFTREETDDGA